MDAGNSWIGDTRLTYIHTLHGAVAPLLITGARPTDVVSCSEMRQCKAKHMAKHYADAPNKGATSSGVPIMAVP